MAEVKERYVCGKCGYLYIDFDEAVACCAPSPDQVYLCGCCNKIFDEEDEAVACCGGDEPVVERCEFTLELPL